MTLGLEFNIVQRRERDGPRDAVDPHPRRSQQLQGAAARLENQLVAGRGADSFGAEGFSGGKH